MTKEEALREALAEQPAPAAQQEPIAIHQVLIDGGWQDREESELWQYSAELWQIRTVYTAPQAQPAQPLTDEQIADYLGDEYHLMTEEELRFFKLGEQAAHGIKENT